MSVRFTPEGESLESARFAREGEGEPVRDELVRDERIVDFPPSPETGSSG